MSDRSFIEEMKLYKHCFDEAEQYIIIMDKNMIVKSVNRAMCDLLKTEEKELIGIEFWNLSIWDKRNSLREKIMFSFRQVINGYKIKYDMSFTDENKKEKIVEFNMKPVFDSHSNILGIMSIGYDITEFKTTLSKFYNTEKEFAMFFETGVDGYFIRKINNPLYVDSKNIGNLFEEIFFNEYIYKYNKALSEVLELDPRHYSNERLYKNQKYDIDIKTLKKYWAEMIRQGHVNFETNFIDKNQNKKFISFTISPMIDDELYSGCFGTVRDITKKKNYEEKLYKLANFDVLTGVANRRYFINCVNDILSKKSISNEFSFVMFDIDHFKNVNDNYGHDMGDYTLKKISSLILSHVFDSGIFARIGGEEFCAFLYMKVEHCTEMVEKILEDIRNTVIEKDNIKIKVTVSAGISPVKTGDKFDYFFRKADKALYNSKNTGRDRLTVSD